MPKIVIQLKDEHISAELNDSQTARDIYDALPLKSKFQTWGDEIYFQIPVSLEIEKPYAKEVVAAGDLGYWPDGDAFCIFWGPTPISKADEIRPASTVNVFGKIEGDYSVFHELKNASVIEIFKEE